jgi:hypothetical protein
MRDIYISDSKIILDDSSTKNLMVMLSKNHDINELSFELL